MNRATLIAYALPALPLAALTLPLYVLVPTFYSETLGLSLASVGAALLFVRIFDALIRPGHWPHRRPMEPGVRAAAGACLRFPCPSPPSPRGNSSGRRKRSARLGLCYGDQCCRSAIQWR